MKALEEDRISKIAVQYTENIVNKEDEPDDTTHLLFWDENNDHDAVIGYIERFKHRMIGLFESHAMYEDE